MPVRPPLEIDTGVQADEPARRSARISSKGSKPAGQSQAPALNPMLPPTPVGPPTPQTAGTYVRNAFRSTGADPGVMNIVPPASPVVSLNKRARASRQQSDDNVVVAGDMMSAVLGSPRGASLSKRRRMADPGGILSGRRPGSARGPPPLHPGTTAILQSPRSRGRQRSSPRRRHSLYTSDGSGEGDDSDGDGGPRVLHGIGPNGNGSSVGVGGGGGPFGSVMSMSLRGGIGSARGFGGSSSRGGPFGDIDASDGGDDDGDNGAEIIPAEPDIHALSASIAGGTDLINASATPRVPPTASARTPGKGFEFPPGSARSTRGSASRSQPGSARGPGNNPFGMGSAQAQAAAAAAAAASSSVFSSASNSSSSSSSSSSAQKSSRRASSADSSSAANKQQSTGKRARPPRPPPKARVSDVRSTVLPGRKKFADHAPKKLEPRIEILEDGRKVKRRKRFNVAQQKILDDEFAADRNPDSKRLQSIADSLLDDEISRDMVKVWFQNRRQKFKKMEAAAAKKK